jgi:predicted dithiol-disulfide oxidoreductase (DUF899 family)
VCESEIVKTALAIVCSLLLVWTPFVPLQAKAAGEKRSTPACCPCAQAQCCAAQAVPESQPVSVAPVSSSPQIQLLTLPSAVAWTLPDSGSVAVSFYSASFSFAAAAPLYARDCARLI